MNNLPRSSDSDCTSTCTSSTEALLSASLLHRAAKGKEGRWPGPTPGSGSFLGGQVTLDLATAAPPTPSLDNGQNQGEPSSGLLGRQWLYSPWPPIEGSHTHPNCHLAWNRLRQAWARPTMVVLTSVHALTMAHVTVPQCALSCSMWKNCCFIHSDWRNSRGDCDWSTWERLKNELSHKGWFNMCGQYLLSDQQ